MVMLIFTYCFNKIIGFKVIPRNDRGHCWCSTLLRGLYGAGFGANIQTGENYIIVENEMVDAGRLYWPLSNDILESLRATIQPLQIKGDLAPYIKRKLGGDKEFPDYDGFALINKSWFLELAKIVKAELGLDEALRRDVLWRH